jgi:hypothetical protein
MNGTGRVLRGLQRAARRAVVTAGVATGLALGSVIVAGAFTYALGSAVTFDALDGDTEQPRKRTRHA